MTKRMSCKRITAGRYIYTDSNGDRRLIEELGLSEGCSEACWHICPEAAKGEGVKYREDGVGFAAAADAGNTLADAKQLCEMWAESKRNVGK